MRAVNLIPVEERRGSGSGGRTSLGVYGLLGGLALLVAAVAAYALAAHHVSQNKAELASVRVQVASAQRQAAALKPYGDFAQLAQKRLQTVESLAKSRFDWAHALRGLSVAIPADVRLDSLTASVSSTSDSGGGGGESGGLRAAIDAPALELGGCATSHDEVARMIAQLRQIDGVTRVSLSHSDDASQSGSSAGAGGACGGGRDTSFGAVVFFGTSVPPQAAVPSAPATATGGAS